MEVLPGAMKLPPAVAQRLHVGAPGAGYFSLVKLESAWRDRASRVLQAALAAAVGGGAVLVADAPGLSVAAVLLVAAAWCRLRSAAYGRKASAA